MDNWYDSIEDETLQNAAKKFDSPEKMVKSYTEAESALGNWKANGVRIPGPDATDEDRQKALDRLKQVSDRVIIRPGEEATDEEKALYYQTLGVPEDPAGYKPPEGLEVSDEEAMSRAVELAKEMKLTKSQFKDFVSKMVEFSQSEGEKTAAQREQDRGIVKRQFGEKYEDTQTLIKDMASHFAHPDHPIPEESPGAWFDLLMERMSQEFVGKGKQAPFHRSEGGGISIDEARDLRDELYGRLTSDEVIPKAERHRLVNKYTKLSGVVAQAEG